MKLQQQITRLMIQQEAARLACQKAGELLERAIEDWAKEQRDNCPQSLRSALEAIKAQPPTQEEIRALAQRVSQPIDF